MMTALKLAGVRASYEIASVGSLAGFTFTESPERTWRS